MDDNWMKESVIVFAVLDSVSYVLYLIIQSY